MLTQLPSQSHVASNPNKVPDQSSLHKPRIQSSLYFTSLHSTLLCPLFLQNPSQVNSMPSNHHPFLSITIITLLILSTQTRPIPPSYTHHCPHLTPPTQTLSHTRSTQSPPVFTSAYTTPTTLSSSPTVTTTLIGISLLPTTTPSLFQLTSTLSIQPFYRYPHRDRFLLRGGPGPRFPTRSRFARFHLSGFWDSLNGNMCLVGLGDGVFLNGRNHDLNVVFNAVYPNFTHVYRSLVIGSLESLDFDARGRLFQTVSIMGFNRLEYNYTLVSGKKREDGLFQNVGRMFRSCGQISSLARYFELDYVNVGDCGGRNCSLIDGVFGFLPRFMVMNEIDCSHQKLVRVSFVVSNVSDIRSGIRQPLDPKRTLVAEGVWNEAKTRIDFVACRILNFTESPLNASIGDCSIRVSLELPDVLTLRNWSVVSGGIWSEKGVADPVYFDRVNIRASGTRRAALPDMKYNYTEIERVGKFCAEKKNGFVSKGKSFPDVFSQDLKFDMDVTNGKGTGAWGKAFPVFVGDRFVQNMYPYFRTPHYDTPHSDTRVLNTTQVNTTLNVAYRIILSPRDEFRVGGKSYLTDEKIRISAEGIYDTKVGRLCMVGCWYRETDGKVPQNATRLDCDIFINIQFPPSKSNGDLVVKGSIESKRDKTSDPLYFHRLDLSGTSLNRYQVQEVFWRMDLEITMVLISNTLACFFIGLQLFHVKKHPDVLPSISIVMLVVITLGHMIPLLLNMEAYFLSTHTKKTLLVESGGWVEVNEVLVRVITMIAFLLEFRLLQLTWSARGDDNGQKTALQKSDKKVIYYSLPLYAGAALIAWLVQRLRSPPKSSFRRYKVNPNASVTFWGGIKSYGGFVLDAFLVPQIMFNVFSDSKESALSIPYYVGTTAVRLLPHAYDLFRAHRAAESFDPWYIYADPGMNFYSTTWDILISCLGLVFVVLVYLQQRFGGRWLVPKRFSDTVAYEMVPLGQ